MVFYSLATLILIGTLWLLFALGRVAYRVLVLRKRQRENTSAVAERVAQAASEPGGSANNPIPIRTPSVVEAKAAEYSCPFCDVEMTVVAHRAEEIDGRRLRIAETKCRQCEHKREIFFELKQVN